MPTICTFVHHESPVHLGPLVGPSLYETTQSEPFTQPLWLIASPRLTMAAAARGLENHWGHMERMILET